MNHGDLRPCFILYDRKIKQFKMIENLRDNLGEGQWVSMLAGADLYTSPSVYKKLVERENEREMEVQHKKPKDLFLLEEKSKQDVFSFGLCL